jgi:hypothetical protein
MTDLKDVIWRIREKFPVDHAELLDLADRIEALTAENERLEKEVAQAWCDDAMPCRQLLDAKQDNERLRAERDAYKVALAAIVEPRIGGGEWSASVARKALTQHLANNATIGDLELPRRLVKHLGAEEPATLIFDILEDKKHRLWSNIGYRDERIMREVATFLDPARAALGDTQ